MIQLCFFEDALSKHLLPVNLTRPTDYIRSGIYRIYEKWLALADTKFHTRLLRPEFEGVYPGKAPESTGPVLWINARYLPDPDTSDDYFSLKPGHGLKWKRHPVVFCLSASDSVNLYDRMDGVFDETLIDDPVTFTATQTGTLLEKPVDLFLNNTREIEHDLKLLKKKTSRFELPSGTFATGDLPVLTTGKVTIEPGTTFITTEGPIFLGDHVHIMAGAVLRGPCVVMDHSLVKMGSHIDHGTTIGPWCKVGGDISQSILQGYGNKAHEGYLGNSYIGEWCNLGAGTITSNMKNTYGNIRMTDWATGKMYDTGLQFCGVVMGDHTKTAIGSKINTGSSTGIFCNLVSDGILAGCFPSFTWLTPAQKQRHDLDKALNTARIVMGRRNVELTPAYEKMVRMLFEISEVQLENAE